MYDVPSKLQLLCGGEEMGVCPWSKLGSCSELRKVKVATCAYVQVTGDLVHTPCSWTSWTNYVTLWQKEDLSNSPKPEKGFLKLFPLKEPNFKF